MIDPDGLVSYLLKGGLKISQDHVQDFWESKKRNGEKWAIESPATHGHIPIAIYGDAARLYSTKDSKYLGIFISLPLWRPRSTRYSRWCIFSIEHSKLYHQETLFPILSRITYKLNLMFENGLMGPDGISYKFACTEIRGDWEWHKLLFNLTSSWKSIDNVCFLCDCVARCDNPKRTYYCLDEDPRWKRFNLVEFLAAQIKQSQFTCASKFHKWINIFQSFYHRCRFSATLLIFTTLSVLLILRVHFCLKFVRPAHIATWLSSRALANMFDARPQPRTDVRREWLRADAQLTLQVEVLKQFACIVFQVEAWVSSIVLFVWPLLVLKSSFVQVARWT